jgi:hypothetical protein
MRCILDLDLAHCSVRKKRGEHDEKVEHDEKFAQPHVEEFKDGTKWRYS